MNPELEKILEQIASILSKMKEEEAQLILFMKEIEMANKEIREKGQETLAKLEQLRDIVAMQHNLIDYIEDAEGLMQNLIDEWVGTYAAVRIAINAAAKILSAAKNKLQDYKNLEQRFVKRIEKVKTAEELLRIKKSLERIAELYSENLETYKSKYQELRSTLIGGLNEMIKLYQIIQNGLDIAFGKDYKILNTPEKLRPLKKGERQLLAQRNFKRLNNSIDLTANPGKRLYEEDEIEIDKRKTKKLIDIFHLISAKVREIGNIFQKVKRLSRELSRIKLVDDKGK